MSLPWPPLPDAVQLRLLVAEVGDTPDHLLQELAPFVWDGYAYTADWWPGLRALYTKRHLLDIAWAQVREAVSFTIGAAVPAGGNTGMQLGQKAQALMAMRAAVQEEIVRVEALARASLSPQAGQLAAQSPIPPPWPGIPTADSPVWAGSVYPDVNANVPYPLSPRVTGSWWRP